MKFVIDESTDMQVGHGLQALGHEVHFIGQDARSVDDPAVLRYAHRLGAVLVTSDSDFGDLVFRFRHRTAGVLFIRLPWIPPADRAARLRTVVEEYQSSLENTFTTVGPHQVRQTPLPE